MKIIGMTDRETRRFRFKELDLYKFIEVTNRMDERGPFIEIVGGPGCSLSVEPRTDNHIRLRLRDDG